MESQRTKKAGTRIVRITKVSKRMPNEKATPNSWTVRSEPAIIEAKVPAMIMPQLVMTPPVDVSAARRPWTGPWRRCSS